MQKHSLRASEWIQLALNRYLDMIYRLAYARMRSKQDAEDVTQEVMLKLCRSGDRIQSETHLRHWLIRVTVNECTNVFRNPWSQKTLPLEEGISSSVESASTTNDRLDAPLARNYELLRSDGSSLSEDSGGTWMGEYAHDPEGKQIFYTYFEKQGLFALDDIVELKLVPMIYNEYADGSSARPQYLLDEAISISPINNPNRDETALMNSYEETDYEGLWVVRH